MYDCRYHLVWITKFRKEWIHEKIQPILEEMLRDICEEMFIKVIRIGMEKDHVHMYVSIPLQTGYIPEAVQKIKGLSSKKLGEMEELKAYFKKFYRKEDAGKRARGYFICTVGEVDDKTIRQYIEEQGKNPPEVE